MQVGAVSVQPPCPFRPVLAVVAVANDYLAQWPQAFAEAGTSAVVFEADYLAHLARFGRLHTNQHVPDHALFVGLSRLRVQIEDAHAGKLLTLGRLVGMAHELVTAAHPEDHTAVLHNGPQIRTLGACEVFREQRLLPVLAATEEEKVAAGRRDPLSQAHVDDIHGNAAPLATL